MDVKAGRWRLIWRGKFRPLETDATEECLAYHTESISPTTMCGNGSTSSPDDRSSCCKPSSVASYHGSVMCVVIIRCRRSYYKEMSTEDVAEEDRANQGRITSGNGQASRFRYCSALQRIGTDGRPSRRRHLSGYPNDTWASWVVIDWLIDWLIGQISCAQSL